MIRSLLALALPFTAQASEIRIITTGADRAILARLAGPEAQAALAAHGMQAP